nr:putative ribonuclease H-like domain-containing protein [Tanacetum cinerariifolium]
MSDHEDEIITTENAPPKNIPQIITVTNIFAKFPYLKKGEYDIWAMKMQNFISSSDLLCWNIVLKGNSAKSMTTDKDDENMDNFYHMIDARDIWNAIKARFGGNAESKKMQKSLLKQKFEEFKIFEEEGLYKGYDKMQKILSQMNTLKIKPKPEDVNIKFLRCLPPSWSSIALILKTKGGLEYISFDDLYNKLKFLEIDTKWYSSSSSTISTVAFISTAGSSQGKLSYQELGNDGYGGYTTTLSASPGSSSFKDLNQMNKEEFEEYDLKHQMAMLSIKKYKEARKDGTDSKAMVVVDGSVDWDKQTEEGNTEPRSLENFGMLAGIKLESDTDSEGEVGFTDDVIPVVVCVSTGPVAAAAVSVSAGPVVVDAAVSIFVGPVVAAAAVSPHSETEFAFIGLYTEVSIPITCPLCCDSKYKLIEKDYHEQREQLNDCVVDLKAHKHAVKSLEKQIKCHQTNQLAYEEKIRVLSYEIEEQSNILEYRQKLVAQAVQEKQELMTKLDNEIANQAKWNNSGTNLYKLIDSSMFVRTKRGLGLDKYIGEGELGIDDSKYSIFHTNSDDLEGQPIYNRFALVEHMKAVPPPLTGNYMPPSNIPDKDESQMVYGKKATDSSKIKTNDDSITHSNDSVLFDFSDRSSEPSTNALKMCDSSVECSRPNHSNHDSNASISSVSAPTNYDFHEQRFAKRNAEGKGILKSRPTGKRVNPNRPKLVSAGRPKPVFAGRPNHISAGRPNLISADQPNPVSAGQPNTDNSLRLEKAKDKGIVDSGCSRSMSGNKDKLEDFEDFHGGEVTFGGSTGKITKKGTIKTKNLNFENVLYVEELNARTPQQNEVAERKNRTLIEAARTMLADSLLPTIFCFEAVATACYVLNRVLVTKPHHKTPYELLTGDKPFISYLKPFGCHVTILNTSDSLGKFDKKSDEGYIVRYSISSKAYRVYNLVSKKIEETINLNFLENKPFVAGTGQAWMFDIDYLTDPLNYSGVSSTNLTAGKEEADRIGLAFPSLNPMLDVGTSSIGSSVSAGTTPHVSAGSTPQMSPCASPIFADRHSSAAGKCHVSASRPTGSTGRHVFVGRPTGSTGRPPGSASSPVSAGRPSGSADRSFIPAAHIHGHPDANNLESSLNVSSTITKRIHTIHPTSQVIGDINSPVHTRSQVKHTGSSESAFISYIHDQRWNNHPDFQLCMFSCFLSQEEPTTVVQALADPDWVEAMQALADPDWVEAMQVEMQQFKNQKVDYAVAHGDRKSTTGGSLHDPSASTTPSQPDNKEQSSEQEISPTTFDAVLTLSQSKIRARAAKIIYKRLKKQQSSFGLDFTDAAIPAAGRVSTGGADPAVVISAGGADPAVVISVANADSVGTFISAGVLVADDPSVTYAPSSPIRDPTKGKAIATPSSPRVAEEQEREIRASAEQSTPRQAELDMIALNLTNKEWIGLVDQVWANPILSAELLGADVSEDTFSVRMVELMNQRRKAIVEMKAKAKRDKPLTPAQQKEYMRGFVKNQSTTIYSTGWTWKDVQGLNDDQLQNETTSVSTGTIIAASDPISAVPSVYDVPSISAASSIPAETPIATGVSTTAGVSESAYVPIIDPAKPVSLSLVSDIRTWEVIPAEFDLGEIHVITRADGFVKRFFTLRELMHWVGRADLMVLYGMLLDKYKLERATGIGLATIQRMLNHGLEIDRYPS